MVENNFLFIVNWFFIFLAISFSFLPLTFKLFFNFSDKGYIFSKVIGSITITYIIFLLGFLHILSFSTLNIYFVIFLLFLINYSLVFFKKISLLKLVKENWKIFLFEELLFVFGLIFWAFIRMAMPDINGLEKFMDFGFLNSILKTEYFPPKDMWYAPYPINYYYFGHLITAVLTKISTLPSNITFNLMLATLFSLTFSCSFSIGINFFYLKSDKVKALFSGLFSSFIVTFAGNLTTIYAFFKSYSLPDKPVPFWNLPFLPFSFPNNYWYPNATRFIPFTIHEFPIYSFVVSDLHGHVLDLPIVLLSIAYSLSIIKRREITYKGGIIFSFLIAIMYMTNAWDGLIYFFLYLFILTYWYFYKKKGKFIISIENLYGIFKNLIVVFIGLVIFSLPFSINFKPFVSGIGILCAPNFLTTIGKIGPLLFETNHCQKSQVWQLVMLYGFFYFIILSLIVFIKKEKNRRLSETEFFIFILIALSTILIFIPEFIYIKDIYPLHYRANTMFKLVYEAFIMLSLVSGFSLIKIISRIKNKFYLFLFIFTTIILISLILVYPIFAITSYYNLRNIKDLDGTKYLKRLYPGDYDLINWLNKNIKGQPIILEANGDSYTNYARISANTGLPTVLGWIVHEWLWRGTYAIVAPRINDVQTLYTSTNLKRVSSLIKKYNISYVVFSDLEREKYPNLTEEIFKKLGKVIFVSKQTKLYKINFSLLAK